jgi:2-methylcitrate dehydratase PrpD
MSSASAMAATSHAADRLAAYAAGLRYERLPAEIVGAAKTCLIDAVACAIFGARFPWSRAIAAVIAASGASGPCSVPGFDRRLDPRQAALALGAYAHAFELDSLRKPGAGAHPGATVALPAFAMAQAQARSGRDLIEAIVAGCEASFRIGAATLHSPELHGFHAPGIVGPFGAAVASGCLIGLSPERLAYALGIAGSCTGGLLAFARSGQGGMVNGFISDARRRAACSLRCSRPKAMTGRARCWRANSACCRASARAPTRPC